jgi:hypothetical protein
MVSYPCLASSNSRESPKFVLTKGKDLDASLPSHKDLDASQVFFLSKDKDDGKPVLAWRRQTLQRAHVPALPDPRPRPMGRALSTTNLIVAHNHDQWKAHCHEQLKPASLHPPPCSHLPAPTSLHPHPCTHLLAPTSPAPGQASGAVVLWASDSEELAGPEMDRVASLRGDVTLVRLAHAAASRHDLPDTGPARLDAAFLSETGVCARTHTHMHTPRHTHQGTHMHALRTYARMREHARARAREHTHTHRAASMRIRQMLPLTHKQYHARTHTHMHAHARAHTHTHSLSLSLSHTHTHAADVFVGTALSSYTYLMHARCEREKEGERESESESDSDSESDSERERER